MGEVGGSSEKQGRKGGENEREGRKERAWERGREGNGAMRRTSF